MSDKTLLGDKMKEFEAVEAMRKLDSSLPIIVRLDGRAFHSFVKGLDRPFDSRLHECMKFATKTAMEECNATLAYTQSDEISLVILTGPESQAFFGGRVQKLCSTMAAVTTLAFYRKVLELLPEYAHRLPTFDARAWNVPDLKEAANSILWRELDAERNSISMLAELHFSCSELHKKNGSEKKKMLETFGIKWEDLPSQFQRGIYFKKVTRETKFTKDELNRLPEKHNARQNPDLIFKRSEIEEVKLPRLVSVTEDERIKLLF